MSAPAGAVARMAAFLAHLRHNGFLTGPGEAGDALVVLERVSPAARPVRLALKVLLCGTREDWNRFDDLFDAFWFAKGVKRVVGSGTPVASRQSQQTNTLPGVWQGHLPPDPTVQFGPVTRPSKTDAAPESSGIATNRLVATQRGSHSRVDFRHLRDPGEREEAEKAAERVARALRDRLSRRHRPNHRGRALDLRRTIRRNLRYGGDLRDLSWKKRPDRPVEIVMFLDVSGSMETYARPFLMFVRGLLGQHLKADAFLVHTRLVRMTEALGDVDPLRALTRLSLLAQGFGGGTCLAQSLAAFNDHYAKSVLNSRSVVIILSDGYDSDPPQALARQLHRLKSRARRLIWLNPLLGWKDYSPVARGMTAALPYVDYFAACNSLAALADLDTELSRL